MESIMLQYTPAEQKAAQLWADFSEKKQDNFWSEYEALLKNVPKKHSVRPVQQEESVFCIPEKNIYHTHYSKAPKEILWACLLLTVLSVISPNTIVNTDFISIVSMLVLPGIAAAWLIYLLSGIHSFEFRTKGLVVHKKMLFYKKFIAWKDLAWVIEEADRLSEDSKLKCYLVFTTKTNKRLWFRHYLTTADKKAVLSLTMQCIKYS